jgi:hypothetical protein
MSTKMCSTAVSTNSGRLRRRLHALCTSSPGANPYRAADNAIASYRRAGDTDSAADYHADACADEHAPPDRYTAPK